MHPLQLPISVLGLHCRAVVPRTRGNFSRRTRIQRLGGCFQEILRYRFRHIYQRFAGTKGTKVCLDQWQDRRQSEIVWRMYWGGVQDYFPWEARCSYGKFWSISMLFDTLIFLNIFWHYFSGGWTSEDEGWCRSCWRWCVDGVQQSKRNNHWFIKWKQQCSSKLLQWWISCS